MCFYIRMKGTLQSVTLGGLEKNNIFPLKLRNNTIMQSEVQQLADGIFI